MPETTTLLEGGCPCVKKECVNHGICAQCIKRHVTETGDIVACLREKAEKRYGGEQK